MEKAFNHSAQSGPEKSSKLLLEETDIGVRGWGLSSSQDVYIRCRTARTQSGSYASVNVGEDLHRGVRPLGLQNARLAAGTR